MKLIEAKMLRFEEYKMKHQYMNINLKIARITIDLVDTTIEQRASSLLHA